MLATIFARDPKKSIINHDEVHKLLKNNIAWPKNYIPHKHVIKKPPPPKTKEEIHLETLKEKHSLIMTYLPKEEVENVIQRLDKICATTNAYGTYKEAGWKSTFMKYKEAAIKEQNIRDKKLRD